MFLALFICSKQGERWMMGGLLASVQDALNAICTHFHVVLRGSDLLQQAAEARSSKAQPLGCLHQVGTSAACLDAACSTLQA